MRRSLSCALFFSLASVYLRGQSSVTITAPSVDSAAAMENRTTYVAAIFPPIAKAAHVTGTVILQIEIESDGSVGKMKIISGPQMLRGAAIEAVKQWRYKPFVQEGTAATVSTTVSFPFMFDKIPADNDNAIQGVFFPLSDECHKAVAENTSTALQADICRQAAEVADQFAPDSRYIERRSAFTYASTALLRNREAKEALHFAEKAVAVSLQADDDGSGRAAVFGVRGQARAATGDLAGSDQDLTRAENEERAALDTPAGHSLHAEYTRALIGLLRFHAQLLQAQGKDEAAQTKLDEAEKLVI
jgi:TonB family protein